VFKENENKAVTFPEWSGAVLEEIVRFASQEFLINRSSHSSTRAVFQFEIKPDVVMELVLVRITLFIKLFLIDLGSLGEQFF